MLAFSNAFRSGFSVAVLSVFFFCIKNKHFMLSFFSSCHSSASLNKSITSSTAVSSAHFFDVFQKPLRFISQQRGYIFYVQSGRSCSFIAGRFFLRKKTPGGGGWCMDRQGGRALSTPGRRGSGFRLAATAHTRSSKGAQDPKMAIFKGRLPGSAWPGAQNRPSVCLLWTGTPEQWFQD